MFQVNLINQATLKSGYSAIRSQLFNTIRSPASTPRFFSNSTRQIFTNTSRRVSTSSISSSVSFYPRLILASSIAFVSYSSLASGGGYLRNDSAIPMEINLDKSRKSIQYQEERLQQTKSRLRSYLNYRELCIGSVTGLILGVVIGKFSSALVFLSLASYFLVQFLEANNIVVIPWKKFIRVGTENIELKDLVLSNPSFKLSFVSSFLIAAFNV